MKYTINANTIDIEYIADAKRKQLKLNSNDPTDMDFFNQLLAAKTNKRDAMCELYRRKILKESDDDVVHIQPLKLDKELKPSKYAEKQELNRRKEELERDKAKIKDEITNLLKDDSKNKDIKTLDNSDLTTPDDATRLKELQRKYGEIDKIHQMIVNQIDSLEIGTADTVNIKELKNLTVNAYENINKTIMETKLSEADQQRLVNSIADSIRPNLESITKAIRGSIRVMREGIQNINNNTDINYVLVQEHLNTLYANLVAVVLIAKNGLAKQESLDTIQTSLNTIEQQIGNINSPDYSTELTDITTKLTEIETALKNIEPVANKEALKETESNIIEALHMNNTEINGFLNLPANLWYPYTYLTNQYKGTITDSISIEQLISNNILKTNKSQRTGYSFNNMTANQVIEEPCFHTENELYLTKDSFESSPFVTKFRDIKPKTLPKKRQNTRGSQYNTTNYYIIPKNRIDELKVGDIIDYLTTQTIQQTSSVFVQKYPKNKPICYLGIMKTLGGGLYSSYVKDVKCIKQTDGTIQNLLNIKKEEDDDGSEGLSGKIMIDLNKSTTDEKLNEIIRLLSQMNYNVFTTTPMYTDLRSSATRKNNRYKQKESTKDVSRGIDLLEIIDEELN